MLILVWDVINSLVLSPGKIGQYPMAADASAPFITRSSAAMTTYTRYKHPHSLSRGRIPCDITAWTNNIKCKYVIMFLDKKNHHVKFQKWLWASVVHICDSSVQFQFLSFPSHATNGLIECKPCFSHFCFASRRTGHLNMILKLVLLAW